MRSSVVEWMSMWMRSKQKLKEEQNSLGNLRRPKAWERPVWGPGKAVLSIAHFFFTLCSHTLQNVWVWMGGVCVNVWVSIRCRLSIISQHRGNIFSKKIKCCLNYSKMILGAKMCTMLPRHAQIKCFPKSFTIKHTWRIKYIWTFLVFVRKRNFQSLTNCSEVNTKDNFWSLREHHRE